MQRKIFLKKIITAAAAGSLLPGQPADAVFFPSEKIKPPLLKKGDLIGLTAPGSYITAEELRDCIKNMEGLGFRVTYSEKILDRFGYFSSKDEERAEDLNNMFARNDVRGILCARGGYGCSRILPLLDYNLIRKNPKVFVGFSDVTALLYGIYGKSGLICFHGPAGISTYNDFTIRYFKEILLKPYDKLELISSHEMQDPENFKVTPVRSGKAEGELVGGNLSVIVSLIGTEYDLPASGKIIFLEETGEEPYRIDKMLTQMIQSGKFSEAAGIALGVFRDCEPKKENPSFENSFSLQEVISDRLGNLNIPVIYGLSFGHIKNKFTIPVGIKAELNTDKQTITLLEPACS